MGIFCCSSDRIHLMNSDIQLFDVSINGLSRMVHFKGDILQNVLSTGPCGQPHRGLASLHIISYTV